MDDQNNPAEMDEPSVEQRSGAVLESIQGEVVQVDQSAVNQIIADTVSLNQSRVQHVSGQQVNIEHSSVGVAHAAAVTINAGSVGICSATEAHIDGDAGVMIGQSVTLNNHRTGVVVTREVTGGSIQAVIFLAGRTNAPVETMVDQRSVALFGIAAGIAIGLILSLVRLIKR